MEDYKFYPDKFTSWLKKQKNRQDPIGDLARDFLLLNSTRLPFKGMIVDEPCLTMELLEKKRACTGSMVAFDKAVKEFMVADKKGEVS